MAGPPGVGKTHLATSLAITAPTSNKGFEERGSVLCDEVIAAVLIDRLLHHCYIVNIRGNSYRMREHQNLMRSASAQRHEEAVLSWPCFARHSWGRSWTPVATLPPS